MIHYTAYHHTGLKLLPKGYEKSLDALCKKAYTELVALKKAHKDATYHIELNFLSDAQIQKVNKQIRGKDTSTDVISVCTVEKGERMADLLDAGVSFGEMFISLPTCARQAKEMNQSMLEELRFLFLHGVLHIFGYDHLTQPEEKEMMSLAYKILGRGEYV